MASQAAGLRRSARERTRRSSASGTALRVPVPGRQPALPCWRAPVSMREANRSSKNNGLPSTPSHTMSRTPSSTSPPRSQRAKFSHQSCPEALAARPAADNRRAESSAPSRRGQGRVPAFVSLTARAARTRAARSAVKRREVGSDQCRSSRASTVGPRETRLASKTREPP